MRQARDIQQSLHRSTMGFQPPIAEDVGDFDTPICV